MRVAIIILVLAAFLWPQIAVATLEVKFTHDYRVTVLATRVGVFEYQTGEQWYRRETVLYAGSKNVSVPVPFFAVISGSVLAIVAPVFLLSCSRRRNASRCDTKT